MNTVSTTTPFVLPGLLARFGSPKVQLWLALAAVYVIWSSTYLVMRWAIEGLPPFLMSGIRFTIAGTILMVWAAVRGAALPTLKQWGGAAIVGALFFLGGNGLVAIAERDIDSGLAAVVCATMPLWLAVFASVSRSATRPRAREWLGLGLGFAGVVTLAWGADFGATPLAAVAIVLSPIAWALGSFLLPRLTMPEGITSPAAQMIAGGLILLTGGMLRGEAIVDPSAESIGALVYLIVFGSLVGFTAFTWLVKHARPAVASSYAYVNPPIAVLLGVLFGAEVLPTTMLVALPLIVLSVMLVVMKAKRA